jgi:NAD(P)H-hydrate epimerase
MKLLTAAQMRVLDGRAINECRIPSLALMENAAQRVVDHIVRNYGPLAGKRIAVVCGKGNNGGDGLAIARILQAVHGAHPHVYLAADPDALATDPAANLEASRAAGVPVSIATEADFEAGLGACDLVADAILGTGARGAPSCLAAAAIDAVNRAGAPVVAVDIPSGIDPDTGAVPGAVVTAASTVTFAAGKAGLYLYPAAAHAGVVEVADIGFPAYLVESADAAAWLIDAESVAAVLPSRTPGRDLNKGTYGHVTVYAGSQGYLGAAILSASAAARSGAGLVTLCVPASTLDSAMAAAPPVLMTRGLPETTERRFSRMALDQALKLAAKGTAAAIGPGIGMNAGDGDADTARFVIEFIHSCPVPLVVDADALNILAAEPDHGANVISSRPAPTVMTPHPGEMGRLLGISTAAVQQDRVAAVRSAASAFRCAVALKGARTLVAAADGTLWINPTGNPGMANGGSGDVLTGVTAVMLGQQSDATRALAAAVYLHGLAGDIGAGELGVDGLIATDIVDRLPAAFRRVRGVALVR